MANIYNANAAYNWVVYNTEFINAAKRLISGILGKNSFNDTDKKRIIEINNLLQQKKKYYTTSYEGSKHTVYTIRQIDSIVKTLQATVRNSSYFTENLVNVLKILNNPHTEKGLSHGNLINEHVVLEDGSVMRFDSMGRPITTAKMGGKRKKVSRKTTSTKKSKCHRCSAKTKTGKRCKSMITTGKRCKRH